MHHQLNTYTTYTVPIYTHAHKVSEWARERENGNVDDDDDDDDDGEGPTVYSRITISPIPFLALATHKLNDVTYMLEAAVRDTYYENKESECWKRKSEINEHTYAFLHPFLALSIPKIMYILYGYRLCVLYTQHTAHHNTTVQRYSQHSGSEIDGQRGNVCPSAWVRLWQRVGMWVVEKRTKRNERTQLSHTRLAVERNTIDRAHNRRTKVCLLWENRHIRRYSK